MSIKPSTFSFIMANRRNAIQVIRKRRDFWHVSSSGNRAHRRHGMEKDHVLHANDRSMHSSRLAHRKPLHQLIPTQICIRKTSTPCREEASNEEVQVGVAFRMSAYSTPKPSKCCRAFFSLHSFCGQFCIQRLRLQLDDNPVWVSDAMKSTTFYIVYLSAELLHLRFVCVSLGGDNVRGRMKNCPRWQRETCSPNPLSSAQ